MVLDPAEKRAVTLVAQLNALRNERAVKRRVSRSKQRDVSCCPFPLFRLLMPLAISCTPHIFTRFSLSSSLQHRPKVSCNAGAVQSSYGMMPVPVPCANGYKLILS